MDVSGGSGQPRSGNGESAEHHTGPTAPAPGSARPGRPQDGGTDHPDAPAPLPPGPASDAGTPAARDRDGHGDGTEKDGTGPQGPGDQSTRTAPGDRPAPAAPAAPGGTPDPAGPEAPAAPHPPHPSAEQPPAAPAPHSPGAPGTRAADHPTHARPDTQRDTRPDVKPDARPDTRSVTRADTRADSRTHTRTGTPSDGGRPGRPPRRPREPGGGLLMGRPFGVPVYVAPSWFLVAALITWVFGGQLDRVLPELGAARYLVSLFFAVAFYASVLVHELAHTVAALRFRLPVRRIQLQFFGGVSEIEKEAETPGREFVLAFVGPLLSLVLAGVFYLALLPVEPGTVPGVLLAGLMISNLIVAAFNLLPGLPLDGGRMLRAVVWKITGKPMSGTVAAAWVGRALAISVLIGLPLLTQAGALGADAVDNVGMDTVMDALLAAILAAIIWTGAGNSLRMARLREHLPELRARNLTRRAVPVETDTPLSEALRRANAAGARALVVVDAEGAPLSLVREAAIVGVPEHRRPWVAVSGLAQDLTDGMRVSAELAGEELLDALRATPATEYLVTEETGEIYGVLSAADVERAFVKAMARPS
ncbi:site-2 protease family protein [Streptomyces sp. NPDC090994]|uniref:site-2 protease family protein n=1 Tax=Streptomyces sp. NPDC090994 TaxID=3365969 RepID=UPI0038123CBD